MCGRFILDERPKRRYLKSFRLTPMYNIAPGFLVPVVTNNSDENIKIMKWGLIPFWAKNPNIGYKMINARDDAVATKPSYKNSFKNKRCLVPASGFYEWKKLEGGKEKIPYLFQLKSHDLFFFAGLYDTWKDPEGKEIDTFTIITTEPNSLMEPIHNRMPVILSENDEQTWLNPQSEASTLIDLLDPYPSNEMETYTVSQEVNSPKNQGPTLVEKVVY